MKIVRSRGESYTQIANGTLERGLMLANKYGKWAENGIVAPKELDAFLRQDPLLVVRQTISVIDKIIRKQRSLRSYNVEAYTDRSHLGQAIWTKLSAIVEKLSDSHSVWEAKLHPYTDAACCYDNPAIDENAKKIEVPSSRETFNGLWHGTFLSETPRDWNSIADAVIMHILTDPSCIAGRMRTAKRGLQDKDGLVGVRAAAIQQSVNDPRKETERHRLKKLRTTEELENCYFSSDIALTIHTTALDSTLNAPLDGQFFGKLLSEHLKSLDLTEPLDKGLWALHNRVRSYYQRIARSDRFRRAVNANNQMALKRILPDSKEQLLRILGGLSDNSDMNNLLRLGKLVVHAADLPIGTDAESATEQFSQRMDHFATSAGQAEIKRNETFTRLWRDAVGLSAQTLRAWIDPQNKLALLPQGGEDKGDFIGNIDLAIATANSLALHHYRQHASLIFGNKQIGESARSAILTPNGDNECKEVLWALLRLTTLIRNTSMHFNTLPKVISAVTKDLILVGPQTLLGNFRERQGTSVTQGALNSLKALLDFDLSLEGQALQDRLTQISAQNYLTAEQITDLINLAMVEKTDTELMLPKFNTLLKRGKAIAAEEGADSAIAVYNGLDLENLAVKGGSANCCRIGVLRLLYENCLADWIASQDWGLVIAPAVCEAHDSHARRQAAFQAKSHYKQSSSPLDSIPVDFVISLPELFAEIAIASSRNAPSQRQYVSDSENQKVAPNQIENFRRDLIARLFVKYLESKELTWIWDISTQLEAPTPWNDDWITTAQVETEQKQWHWQFYAWLYLVPFDDVSLLRHQLRKTMAFALVSRGRQRRTEGSEESHLTSDQLTVIKDVDRLIALYLAVQGAGFSGTEVSSVDARIQSLFEDGAEAASLFSQHTVDHDVTYPGTQRGLRNMLRFAHFATLETVFAKHKITAAEITELEAMRAADTVDKLAQRRKLHKSLEALAKATPFNALSVQNQSAEYRKLVGETTLHRFKANAARLGEHARLHQLMMRVIGRLADFTAMWERDRLFVFVGLLYKQAGGNLGISMEGATVSLTWTNGTIQQSLKMWDGAKGLMRFNFEDKIELLTDDHRQMFLKNFIKIDQQHRLDTSMGSQRGVGKKVPPFPPRRSDKYQSRAQIRNDLAHYNPLVGTNAKRLNLSYVTNAVRSLLSYDRKLKNGVSRAITDIIAEDGVLLQWQMVHDRLKNPAVLPGLEQHLHFLPPKHQAKYGFCVPLASPRYCSMVKALFDFDKGGLRDWDDVVAERKEPKQKRSGELRYPPFAHEARVPDILSEYKLNPIFTSDQT